MNFKEGYSVKFKDTVTLEMLIAEGIPAPRAKEILDKVHVVCDISGRALMLKKHTQWRLPFDMFDFVHVQLDSLRKCLNEGVGEDHPHVASYALRGLDENGVIADKLCVAYICHARLTTPHEWEKVTEVALHVKNYFKKDHFTDEQADAYKEYISWVLNDSPWAMAFKTKHVWVATRYGIEMDVSVAHNIVAAAAIALRLGSEYVNFSLNWKLFKKEGLTPNQAFLLASFTNVNSYVPALKLTLNTHMGGHHVVSSSQGFKHLVKFLEKGYSEEAKKGKTLLQGSIGYSILNPIAPENHKGETVTKALMGLPSYGIVADNGWGQIKGILDAKAYIQQFQEAYNAAI